jgi:hypothetical protein
MVNSPSSCTLGMITPMFPTMLVLSATTCCPLHSTKYPPDAAISLANVWVLRPCLYPNYRILLQMIWLCTGRPPGELIETAMAAARDVEILESRLVTLSVLSGGSCTIRG